MKLIRFFVTCAVIIATAANATAQQQPPAESAGPSAELLKEYEAILKHKFYRDASELLRSLERVGTEKPADLPANERFLLHFVTGDWGGVRKELSTMPDDFAVKVYNKMLEDLTSNRKPVIQLEDVMGIADAAPEGITGDNVRRLGQLLGIAVPVSESYWLVDRLQKGSDTLGGKDPEKRLLAARVLIAGGFKDLARSYLPTTDKIDQIEDEKVRKELLAFVATQEDRETIQRTEVQEIWDDNIQILIDAETSGARGSDRFKAMSAISKVINQVPHATLAPVFNDLVKSQPETAIKLIASLQRKIQSDGNANAETRTSNIGLQAAVANQLSGLVSPGEQPWAQVIELMAGFWAQEAENTFTQQTASSPRTHVLPEDMLAHAPTGKWAESLTAATRDRIDVAVSRLILTGAQFDQAAERIVEIGKRSPRAGAALAEDFLGIWATKHNPEIPESLRRKFNLPEGTRIPVTPIMMEKNITSLARMMALFREAKIAPSDYSKVVDAFDLAYSNAETYRTSHIEKVFGKMATMDEPLFFLILSRMSGNLGERWRTMDVQKSGMTQRNEEQTLEMVREGYTTALQLIDEWAASHKDNSRALTLAGTLLVDWGDFEYFQELVSSDTQIRLAGYKEKNLQAQDYFNRGTESYGQKVADLTPGEYRVDAYLGWFNGLLGIGSNGQINLSKAMNRAALNRIREQMEALPGKASSAHINLFARIVNERLSDEEEPLHEDLKYRYLASALVITKDNPFTLGATKKVDYLDQLLSEVRLQTRVDGPNTVGRDQDFGIIVSIVHTEAMGRAANFGQYLSNEEDAGRTRPTKSSPLVRKMLTAQGPRDLLELNITESLSPFFDIQTITFATADAKPRQTAEVGWEETILAYLHVRAIDASVDKIPPVKLDLKFVDLSGPVTIPAESAETIIKVATDSVEARPASQIEVTQTLDNRQLNINGSLNLEIKATATGLVPDLDDLLDLESADTVAVRNINTHEGLQITEFNTWGDEVAPHSERRWTISLDGDQVRASKTPINYRFPEVKAAGATAVFQSYTDMNLTTLTDPTIQLSREVTASEVVQVAAANPYFLPAIIGGGILLLVIIVIAIAMSRRTPKERPLRARDVFTMPAEVDGFAVVALLRRLCTSPLVNLKEKQRLELEADLKRVEQACFDADVQTVPEDDLRTIASKWLRIAT